MVRRNGITDFIENTLPSAISPMFLLYHRKNKNSNTNSAIDVNRYIRIKMLLDAMVPQYMPKKFAINYNQG